MVNCVFLIVYVITRVWYYWPWLHISNMFSRWKIDFIFSYNLRLRIFLECIWMIPKLFNLQWFENLWFIFYFSRHHLLIDNYWYLLISYLFIWSLIWSTELFWKITALLIMVPSKWARYFRLLIDIFILFILLCLPYIVYWGSIDYWSTFAFNFNIFFTWLIKIINIILLSL